MGCGGSKEVDEKEARKINYYFKRIYVPSFDNFFDAARAVLEKAEGLREGLQDAREEGAEWAHTWKLKEYTYVETVKVLFWSLSCNGGGQVSKAKPSVVDEAPFITLDYFEGLYWDTRKLCDSFEAFLGAVGKAPVEIPKMISDLADMIQKGADLTAKAKDELKAANIPPLKIPGTMAAIGSNMNQLKSEFAKIEKLKGISEEALKDVKALLPEIKKIIAEADTVGKPASEAGCKTPAEVFDKFHKGERKTKEDIEKEQKAAEEAKKKKEKNAKNKEGEKKEGEKKEGEKKEGAANTAAEKK